jgi:flagellar hook assembly protein FlgD
VPRTTRLSLKVYDISGKQVTNLVRNQKAKPGFYNQVWNCTDGRGRKVGNGVYFYRLVSSEQSAKSSRQSQVRTRKLVIAR